MALPRRLVQDAGSPSLARPSRAASILEDLVDGLEHIAGRAIGHIAAAPAGNSARSSMRLQKCVRASSKAAGSAPWKLKIDCLRSPTTKSVRSTSGACAAAGEEFLRQRLDDLPLRRARVLRFVDKDMIDAAVELVENPGGGRLLVQEPRGARDEIVEVIAAIAALQRFIVVDDARRDGEEIAGRLDHCRGRRACRAESKTRSCSAFEEARRARMRCLQAFVDDRRQSSGFAADAAVRNRSCRIADARLRQERRNAWPLLRIGLVASD